MSYYKHSVVLSKDENKGNNTICPLQQPPLSHEKSLYHAQRLRFAIPRNRSQLVRFFASVFLCLSVLVSFLCHHRYYSWFSSDSSVKHKLSSFLNTSRKNIIISVKDRQVQHSYSAGETNLLPDNLNHTIAKARVVPAALDTSLPLIHIVNTRFQQHARNLTAIGNARLELFETFCLPTMIHQTIQPQQANQTSQLYRFLWIIRTDPKLDSKLRERMENLLKPYPNFFLVGSNHKYSWRNGKAGEELLFGAKEGRTNVYTGDVMLLRAAYDNRENKIVLETRIDADDGLPLPYLEYTQTSAMQRLSDRQVSRKDEEVVDSNLSANITQVKWMFWCIQKAIIWHPSISLVQDSRSSSTSKEEEESGVLNWEERFFCLTPGLTVGLSVGVYDSEVPKYGHHRLAKQLHENRNNPKKSCGLHESGHSCIQVLDNVLALRSRSPTSAGMLDVVVPKDLITEEFQYSTEETKAHWSMMKKRFAVEKDRVSRTNHYIQTNLVSILQENLLGQCTPGHSCKSSSREILQSMIKLHTSKQTK